MYNYKIENRLNVKISGYYSKLLYVVITDAFNGDLVFFIQQSTGLRLVCVCDVSYLQFTVHTYNSYLHNLGLGLQGGHSVYLS